MKMIFEVQKPESQIDSHNWFIYLAAGGLIALALVFYRNLQPATVGLILLVGLLTYLRRKNSFYLLISDEGIIFRNKYSVRWTVRKENLKNMDYKPVHISSRNPERVLVSLLFTCKDGDSYSMPMVYFTEEQAKEIQIAIDRINH